MNRKKVTSTDVAKRAGVSQATVSMVLNQKYNVSFSRETIKKVEQAAKELGYTNEKKPRTSRIRMRGTIFVVCPNFTNPYYFSLIQGKMCIRDRRDPIDDIYKINKELEAYDQKLMERPQVIAANKTDMIYSEDEDPVERIRQEFEPQGIRVFSISAATGKGLKELLYYVKSLLDKIDKEPVIFEQEFFPEDVLITENLPYTVKQDEEDEHLFYIEGPKIEKMLGYTNLDSEKGFSFFQKFLRESGILADLEAAGIEEGDTVRMYGFDFDYYK